jgi:hypothetical protein
MHRKFAELLHGYKRDVFQIQHEQKDIETITSECMELCDDVLDQKYSYHFHKLPDADRAEIINMINNYTREAILPPVVERILKRQIVLEHRVAAMDKFLAKMLEALSSPVDALN